MTCCALLLLPPAEAFLSPFVTRVPAVPAPQGSLLGYRSKPLVRTYPCGINSVQHRGGWGGRQPSSLELKNANAEKDDPVSSGPIKLQVGSIYDSSVYVVIPGRQIVLDRVCTALHSSTTVPYYDVSLSDTLRRLFLPDVLAGLQ